MRRGIVVVAVLSLLTSALTAGPALAGPQGCPAGYVMFDRSPSDGGPPAYQPGETVTASGTITNTEAGVRSVILRAGSGDGPVLGEAPVDEHGSWLGLSFAMPQEATGSYVVVLEARDSDGVMLPGLPYPFTLRVGAPPAPPEAAPAPAARREAPKAARKPVSRAPSAPKAARPAPAPASAPAAAPVVAAPVPAAAPAVATRTPAGERARPAARPAPRPRAAEPADTGKVPVVAQAPRAAVPTEPSTPPPALLVLAASALLLAGFLLGRARRRPAPALAHEPAARPITADALGSTPAAPEPPPVADELEEALQAMLAEADARDAPVPRTPVV